MAIREISQPVVDYLQETADGDFPTQLFMINLERFYDLRNCSVLAAQANDEQYFRKWPTRVNTVSDTIKVENLDGSDWYFVQVPFYWSVSNGQKVRMITWLLSPGFSLFYGSLRVKALHHREPVLPDAPY